MSLAEGEILPNDLTIEQQNLLKEVNKNKQQKYSALKNRSLQRFSSSSSCIFVLYFHCNQLLTNAYLKIKIKIFITVVTSININEMSKDKTNIQVECLLILQKLFDILEHGLDICLRIVLCYKLAMQLEKSYQVLLVLNNPIQFLQEVTESNIKDKSEIINDIIIAYKIDNDTVATFLAENITLNITSAVKGI